MKNVYLVLTLVLLFSFILMPLIAVKGSDKTASTQSSQHNNTFDQPAKVNAEYVKNFKIYLSDEKKTVTVSREEYLSGVIASEIPATYEDETIKAQALAAYTFAVYRYGQNKSSGSEYDITSDSTFDQGYLTEGKRKQKWGAKAAEYEEKILKNIKAVDNLLITYNDSPILAAYHSISPGNTESAKNIWGSDYPYLVPVVSTGDLLCTDYLSENKFSSEDFAKKLTSLECKVSGDPSSYIGEVKKSSSGTVTEITLCSKKFTGTQIRTAFGLRSAAFDLSFKDSNFVFSVKGYGHGVGMSQYGANYMAQQGSAYNDIISAYYTGAKISKVE